MLRLTSKRTNLFFPQAMRAFGGAPHDPNHKYEYLKSPAQNTNYKIPSEVDIGYQLPKQGIMNERVHQWIAARWAPDRDDILDNTEVNKFSAYYWWGSSAILQNKLFLKLGKMLFSGAPVNVDHHANFNGVKASENGIFLYKSNQADHAQKGRIIDYLLLVSTVGFVTGCSNFLFLPMMMILLALPRKHANMVYFTYHAELLPHTEQVVFHKSSFFGNVRRQYVDIKNLVKIDAATVPANQLWDAMMFDDQLVFKDQETKEVFVFDKEGLWNKDALEHPLLY